jgi:hypothetical protein
MSGSAQINNAGFSAGMNTGRRVAIQSGQPPPVFSPAVRFTPERLSLSQAIRCVVYWVAMIAIGLVMARSGFSYLHQARSERPGLHSIK